jgi:hypothetical protein
VYSFLFDKNFCIGFGPLFDLIASVYMASNLVPITVAHGDGIGPEIMAASLHIMKAAGRDH